MTQGSKYPSVKCAALKFTSPNHESVNFLPLFHALSYCIFEVLNFSFVHSTHIDQKDQKFRDVWFRGSRFLCGLSLTCFLTNHVTMRRTLHLLGPQILSSPN